MVPAVMVGERAGKVRVTCDGSEDMALDQAGNVPRLAPPAVADAAATLGFTAKKERIAPDVRAEAARAITGTIFLIPPLTRRRLVIRTLLLGIAIATTPHEIDRSSTGPPQNGQRALLTTRDLGILQPK
jgi:hypothetical protein